MNAPSPPHSTGFGAPAAGQKRHPSIVSQLFTTLGAEGVAFFSGILFSIVVTRSLQPGGKGAFATVVTYAGVASAVFSFGLPKSVLFFLTRQRTHTRAVVLVAATRILPAGILGSAILQLLLLPAGGNAPRQSAYLAAAISAATLTYGMREAFLRADRRIHDLNLATVASSSVQLLLAVALAAAGLLTPQGALAVVALAATGRCIALLRLHSKAESDPASAGPTWRMVAAALLRYGATYQLYSMLWTLHCRGDVLLLAWLRSEEETGIYSTGANLAQTLWRAPAIITFVTVPYMAQLSKDSQIVEITAASMRLAILPLALGAAVLGLGSDHITVFLYGTEFARSAGTLKMLCPGAVSASLYLLASACLVARGELAPLLIAGAMTLALNVALNLTWIPIYSASGAALASTISYTVACLLVVTYLARTHNTSITQFLIPRTSDLAGAWSTLRKR